ncbi:hypothetical protein F511_31652 [Dorcoceras hygrometricum]|uniref:Uncharacterized protein n=1 Tax=Dorcoceras hygrometricum TaxID=472368 RepID=A0A2Z7DAL0_9LAMI|nr:hypothetical protein F511_31652 [Dorcoceras hygrometricum]
MVQVKVQQLVVADPDPPPGEAAEEQKTNGRETINTIDNKTIVIHRVFKTLPCWHLCLAPTGITRTRLFSVDCGRNRQYGPRPEMRLLRQPALEVLTRSARTDSPRRIGRKRFPAKRRRRRILKRGGGGASASIWWIACFAKDCKTAALDLRETTASWTYKEPAAFCLHAKIQQMVCDDTTSWFSHTVAADVHLWSLGVLTAAGCGIGSVHELLGLGLDHNITSHQNPSLQLLCAAPPSPTRPIGRRPLRRRRAAAVCRRSRGLTCSDHRDEEIPFVPNLSGLLVQADKGILLLIVELIKEFLPPPTLKCQIPCESGRSQAPRRQQGIPGFTAGRGFSPAGGAPGGG